MKKLKKNFPKIDSSWTLFLDRDGIINKKVEKGYVCKWRDFKFIPSFLEHIEDLSRMFGHIVIVTNQSCVAKRLISRSQLQAIHRKMLKKIRDAGGRIDKIYYCPHDILDNCNCRKPKIGMALLAKENFKDINLKKSIMLGDSPADMEFGEKTGMVTVLISGKKGVNSSRNADYVVSNFKGVLQLF